MKVETIKSGEYSTRGLWFPPELEPYAKQLQVRLGTLTSQLISHLKYEWKRKGYQRKNITGNISIVNWEQLYNAQGKTYYEVTYDLVITYKTLMATNTYTYAERRKAIVIIIKDISNKTHLWVAEILNEGITTYRPYLMPLVDKDNEIEDVSYIIIKSPSSYDIERVNIAQDPTTKKIIISLIDGVIVARPVVSGYYVDDEFKEPKVKLSLESVSITHAFGGSRSVLSVTYIAKSSSNMFKIAVYTVKKYNIATPKIFEINNQAYENPKTFIGVKTGEKISIKLTGKLELISGRLVLGEIYKEENGKLLLYPYKVEVIQKADSTYAKALYARIKTTTVKKIIIKTYRTRLIT